MKFWGMFVMLDDRLSPLEKGLSPSPDGVDEALRRIRALQPLIEANRGEAERLGRLPDAVSAAFIEQDLYRILIPRDIGGWGLDPLALFDLCVELGSYDGSVAWNFAAAASAAPLMGELPLDWLKAFFSNPDCVAAGSLVPTGKAERMEDGDWRLSGRWSWMSGIYSAKWVMLSAVIHEDGRPMMGANGMPEMRVFVLPKDADCVLDIWQVGGMRGTGSADYACDGAIVEDRMSGRPFSGQSTHPDPIFRLPPSFFGLGFVATALGIGRRTVDGLKTLAATKISLGRGSLRDQPVAHHAVAKSEALLRSSRLYVEGSIGAVWDMVRTDRPLTLEMRARVRGSYVHAVEAAEEAVQLCYRAAGGSALWESGPFEQALRDVFAVGCHVGFQRATIEEAGRVELGLEPRGPMF